jgi:hypothetical protein
MFEMLPAAQTGIDFTNTLSENDSLNILNYVYYYNGGGVGVADFNNDGKEDLFFTGNETSCRLYLNKGHLQFEDVTAAAQIHTTQWCTGVAIADVNADGWKDIYVCTAGYPDPNRRKNLLFINQGSSGKTTFIESAESYGLADTAYSTQAAFFDYDRDGDLDLYVMNHANERQTLNTPLPKKTHGEGSSNDHLYRNNGNQTFTNVTTATGILTEGYGLGIAISDVNQDGWPDVYISNDFIYNDLLWINEGGKHFSNQIDRYIQHQSYNGMGCDFADFNNDARPDLAVMDMLPTSDFDQKTMAGALTWNKEQLIAQAGYAPQCVRNTLQLAGNGGSSNTPVFQEIGQMAGIAATDWSWAPLFADLDNDGWKDLFITTGYLRDITDKDFIDYSNNLSLFKSVATANRDLMPKVRQLKAKNTHNRVFQNNHNLTFTLRSDAWGLSQTGFSNGAAYADLDEDGDLDWVVNKINQPAAIGENKANQLTTNCFLNIRLDGMAGNKAGLGARVWIVSGSQKQYLEQYLSRGFLSSVSEVLHFGLGEKTSIDTLEIRWNDSKSQVLTNIAANQTITLHQTDARLTPLADVPVSKPLFAELSAQQSIHFKHIQPVFNDFQSQPLLPYGFSQVGPPIAVGDFNHDGLDDCYVGGGKDQAGQLFYQKPNGQFDTKPLAESAQSAPTAALCFDANRDGYIDLYVVNGGSYWEANNKFYQDRLYLNDRKGNLIWAKTALPDMFSPGACVSAGDLEGDGDLDLWVGGSAEPGNYPFPARSYLLRNDGGNFTDITHAVAPDLEKIGLVNAAHWADIDQDGDADLVLAGTWMPLTVFKNQQGVLKNATESMGLRTSLGWWNTLEVKDLDHDGDLDIVAGNLGLNTTYQASQEHPLKLYFEDFDHNGKSDAILCRYTHGKEKPMYSRDQLCVQINGLAKKYPRYALYAAASIQEMLGDEAVRKAQVLSCNTLQSATFHQSKGRFIAHPLPLQAQMAPVHAMLSRDFNGDGHFDVLLVGNDASLPVSVGPADALHGLLLVGDGKGNFEALGADKSGLVVLGAGRSLAVLPLKSGKNLLLVGVNGGPLLEFTCSN